jgi:hypothetical protein
MHYLQHVQIGKRLRRQRKRNHRMCSHGVPVVVVISGVLIGDVNEVAAGKVLQELLGIAPAGLRGAIHRLVGHVERILAPVAATLTARSEASFVVRLRRSKTALLHLPRSRETPLLHCKRCGEVLLHLATEVAP